MIKSILAQLTADKMLGIAGGGLAVSSMGFGLYMNIHGPAASFGHSDYFTVYAQLVGHRAPKIQPEKPMPMPAPAPDDGLDMTATASIAAAPRPKSPIDLAIAQANAAIIQSVTLESVDADSAIVASGGHIRTVRVGDMMPEAGEVLQILSGPRPAVKTSRGFIVSGR